MLVHGDYRLDNVIVDVQGRIVAILDWEIATLGNPVADLALLVCYWAGTGDEAVGPTALAGFPTRSEIVARYRELSGRDLHRFDWYLGFSYWKLACIAQGVLARYRDGTGGGDGTVDADRLATTVAVLVARAEEALSAGRTVEP